MVTRALWRTTAALVLATCATHAICAGAAVSANSAVGIGTDTAPITHWVHADFAREAAGEYDAPDTLPAALSEPRIWSNVALPYAIAQTALAWDAPSKQANVTWYRLTQPPSAPEAHASGEDIHLYVPRWQTIGTLAVYADGNLLYRTRGSRLWNGFNRPVWLPLNASANGTAPKVILIRMASQAGAGAALSTAWVGPDEALRWRYRMRHWIQIDAIAVATWAFFILGLFSLAVWSVRRKESIYGIFFATSLAYLLCSLHFTIGELPPVLSDAWFSWLSVNSMHWGVMGVFLFMLRINQSGMHGLGKGMLAASIALSLLTLPAPTPLAVRVMVVPWVYNLTAVLAFTVVYIGLRDAWRSRSREGLVLALGFFMTVLIGLYDMALARNLISIENVYLVPYNAIGIFTIFMVIVYRRYVNAIGDVEHANAVLENRLAARESELSQSYERLREFERQQTLTDERQRMTQEMHDGIGSSLISALRMVECGQLDADQTTQVLKECIDDLKLAIDSLEVTDPDVLALLAALRFRLGPRLQVAGIDLHWRVVDLPPLPWLDAQSALNILRILQEILANIVKHSAAKRIEFTTGFDALGVTISILNEGGVPFAPCPSDEPKAAGSGRGLANVKNRCRAIDARCTWEATNSGCRFSLWLPLQRLP